MKKSPDQESAGTAHPGGLQFFLFLSDVGRARDER